MMVSGRKSLLLPFKLDRNGNKRRQRLGVSRGNYLWRRSQGRRRRFQRGLEIGIAVVEEEIAAAWMVLRLVDWVLVLLSSRHLPHHPFPLPLHLHGAKVAVLLAEKLLATIVELHETVQLTLHHLSQPIHTQQ
jgi:hypothetical protein